MKINFTLIIMLQSLIAIGQTFSYNGITTTPNGNLHILFVFVGFDDQTSADDITDWAHDDIPEWAKGDFNEIIDKDDSQIHTIKNLTSYYHTMSEGNFIITGEVYPELLIVTPTYTPLGLDYSDALLDAVELINLQTNLSFDYNYGNRFDERVNNPLYLFDNSLYSNITLDPAEPDGKIDFICFVYRIGENCNGYAGLHTDAGELEDDNTPVNIFQIKTGISITSMCSDSKSLRQVFSHEFAHNIYGAPHTWGVNGVVGDYYYSYNGWGFMAPFQIMQSANAWERWWLNWIAPQEITTNGTYTLKDYLTEGDAMRIPIPKTGPTETDQYLFLENHQLLNYYDRKPVYAGESDPLTAGVYALITAKGHSRTTTINSSNPNANMFKSLNAAGRNDFTIDGYKTVEKVGDATEQHPIFVKGEDNPISGQSNWEWIRSDFDLTDTIEISNASNRQGDGTSDFEDYNDIKFAAAEKIDGSATDTYAFAGTADVPFQVGDEISMSGIIPALNYPQFDGAGDSLYPYYLNGLKVKLLSFNNTTKEYSIEVKFDDWEVRENKRWCGNIIMPENEDLVIKDNVTLTLNKTGTPNRRLEDVVHGFFTPTTFRIQSGATLTLKSGASLLIDDYSTLIIENGAELIIETNAKLEVKNNATVILQSGATIKATHSGAVIRIDDGGILVMEGNDIQLNNTNAKIELKGGGTIETADNVDFTFTGTGHLVYYEDGIFDLGTGSRFYLKGTGKTDMKCWLQTDADLYISTRDVWLEDCKISYYNGSRMRNAYANYYSENVMYNTGGTSAIHGISAYDTETFYITQATFDGFATPIKLENIDVCPDDVNVEIRQTTIKNYTTQGIFALDVDRMYLYANSIEGNANATTGLWLEDVVECNVEAGTIKNHTNQPGVMLYNTRYFILDGATIKSNNRGIESYRSNIYLRNQATIKQNTTEGIYALSAIDDTEDPDILCKIVVGDVGCGWIIQNATGILGEDILLDIDAITHAINEADEEQPNRFDGNTTQAIDVCYDYFDDTYISNTLLAKGNYWSGGAAPSGSDVTTGFNANCNDITTDASLYVSSTPANCDCPANCTDIEDEEELTLRMTNNSCGYYINEQGGGRISIAEKYQEAYQLFLANDFNYAYQKFNWIKNRVEAEYPQGLPDGICKDLYAKAYWYKDQMAEIAEVHCQYPFYERTVEDNTIIPQFSVFPNPAQNTVTITCTEIGEAEYTIFSASGIRIHNGRFEGSTQLQLENYASGIYFIQLQTETVAEILKLMVE